MSLQNIIHETIEDKFTDPLFINTLERKDSGIRIIKFIHV